ncbi:hypothetical protein MZK49_21680 [Ensifer sesbaniae]|uniref:hypothetical protein n=1 Tax=Ensifer sesbaniae TaxID=1214071 RepID=UPI001569D6AF|nr:hypothetical protein [Ensifer sesbaniae]MCK3779318.1 hypothetical protein [Ensifer sesbaniae]
MALSVGLSITQYSKYMAIVKHHEPNRPALNVSVAAGIDAYDEAGVVKGRKTKAGGPPKA